MPRSREPILWALFSAGGMLSALVFPVLAFVLWVAMPLGWVESLAWQDLAGMVRHPLTRLFLFALAMLSLFHWAHRFRYTLYDGLQLYHLNQLIAVVTYGVAVVLSGVAGYLVFVVL